MNTRDTIKCSKHEKKAPEREESVLSYDETLKQHNGKIETYIRLLKHITEKDPLSLILHSFQACQHKYLRILTFSSRTICT